MFKPVHPGRILRKDVIEFLGHSVASVAEICGMDKEELQDILDEKAPITLDAAIKISKYFGKKDMWLRLQAAYNIYDRQHSTTSTLRIRV